MKKSEEKSKKTCRKVKNMKKIKKSAEHGEK